MEHHSQHSSTNDTKKKLEGQLRECFGRVVYSHKTHEKCADILLDRLSNIKLWQIILSALTTGGFVSAFFGAGATGAGIGVLVSTTLLILNAYAKNYDLGEIAQKHKQAATDIWLVREKYLSLITDLASDNVALNEVRVARDDLIEELHSIYSGAPSTNIKAYKRAQHALQRSEDMTFSDLEIDAFLPSDLRRSEG